jgi:hypothetical protein
MKRKARTWRVWVANDGDGYGGLMFDEPEWNGYAFETNDDVGLCRRGTRFARYLLGLASLPPRGTAWLVEVTAPGRSRILKRMKGGET